MRLLFISLVTFFAFSFSVAQADETINPDVLAIKIIRDQSNKALTAHDLEKFVAFFDHDYIISYGSSKKSLSRDAEIDALKKSFAESPDMDYLRTPKSVYISASHPLAMEHGVWRGWQNKDTVFSGRYTAGWRKTDGIWKIHNELFVTLKCEGKNC
jgi:hypothetical protein